jgi:hypothetical protein
MLIPKANRKAIYQHLFKEGVLVAEKDTNAPKHMELGDIPNLEVIMACKVRECACVCLCVCGALELAFTSGGTAVEGGARESACFFPLGFHHLFSLSLSSLA